MIDRELVERNVKSFLYKHPAKRSNLGHSLSMLIAVLAVITVPIAVSFVPGHVKGDIYPKNIAGYVYDQAGVPVNSAAVTVKMMNGATVVSTRTSTTGLTGFFTVSFGPFDWEVNYTIHVEAVKNALTGVNETLAHSAQDDPIEWVNVTLGVFIPEFSDYLPLAGGFALVAVLAAGASRRKGNRS